MCQPRPPFDRCHPYHRRCGAGHWRPHRCRRPQPTRPTCSVQAGPNVVPAAEHRCRHRRACLIPVHTATCRKSLVAGAGAQADCPCKQNSYQADSEEQEEWEEQEEQVVQVALEALVAQEAQDAHGYTTRRR
ncbi:unnamed protein product [Closterium sp. NIES-54]